MSDFPIALGHRSSGAETIRAMQRNQIKWAFRPRLLYRQAVRLADFSPTAGLTQTLTLDTLFPNNTFPNTFRQRGVDLLEGCTVENLELPDGGGVASLTIEVGGTFDAGVDADGLLTSSNLLGGGAAVGDILNTPAAANYDNRYESGFSPTVTLTADVNLNTLTALGFEVLIPWTPRAEVSG